MINQNCQWGLEELFVYFRGSWLYLSLSFKDFPCSSSNFFFFESKYRKVALGLSCICSALLRLRMSALSCGFVKIVVFLPSPYLLPHFSSISIKSRQKLVTLCFFRTNVCWFLDNLNLISKLTLLLFLFSSHQIKCLKDAKYNYQNPFITNVPQNISRNTHTHTRKRYKCHRDHLCVICDCFSTSGSLRNTAKRIQTWTLHQTNKKIYIISLCMCPTLESNGHTFE